MGLMRHAFLFCLLLLTALAGAQETHPAWQALTEQDQAWNRGDLDTFLEGYVKTDDLSMTSGGEITRGYPAVRQYYVEHYGSDKSTMGQLSSELVQLTPLGDDHLMVVCKWRLERAGRPTVGGVYTLVLARTPSGWKILHDHTSELAP